MATRHVGPIAATNLDVVTVAYVAALKFVTVIGDGAALSYTVTHSLNSQAVGVSVLSSEAFPPNVTSVTVPTASTVTIVFDRAPLASSVNVRIS